MQIWRWLCYDFIIMVMAELIQLPLKEMLFDRHFLDIYKFDYSFLTTYKIALWTQQLC